MNELQKYFEELEKKVNGAYALAKRAKSKSIDPSDQVEIPLAKNMAERVEGLIGVAAPQIIGKGLPQRIEQLEKEYGKLDWRVGLEVAYEVSKEKFLFLGKNKSLSWPTWHLQSVKKNHKTYSSTYKLVNLK